ncbi:Gamma-D-glutamyl-L-lysine endopeptidase [Pedobacter sp. Bi27]|uniref:C40 family peptidase n=1 Tax=unclassified Pedobacter TaxID=2628915 RepID=UPI001D47E143|nr:MULTISPECIES: C40 family peptidase [unclassified Pedobacter]CAH0152348.1 Gamma-D-glutamyl-L-lysine endopeptidase [Pedobacter sp. Bi126]CAH0152826.1 Gamma-D-glutamyl-L-lysine endopeptidase [Pedobacter sp. Bi27]CAH0205935.1 Gamma-D-glutamyl-L-lysine endopeptidase [Pedobacter sp. Bi36]
MENQYGICRVAVASLRADASDKAEIVSQLLFGDHVEIIQKEGRWWLIQNGYDGYEGWMDFRQLAPITQSQFAEMHDCKLLAPLSFSNVLTAADGSSYHLSPASNLPFLKDGFCYAGEEKFKLNFEAYDNSAVDFVGKVTETAMFFQNIPYLWGGRNLFGLDCSGFVQTVFKMLGIKLNRDASQQAEQGELVGFLAECKAGDVAFFDNDEGRITHVGIMLSPNEIIHSSAKVKIDPIDDQGIFNKELGKYSHKLRIIKRFVE